MLCKQHYERMIEEEIDSIVDGNILNTQFRPFEIKTIKAYY